MPAHNSTYTHSLSLSLSLCVIYTHKSLLEPVSQTNLKPVLVNDPHTQGGQHRQALCQAVVLLHLTASQVTHPLKYNTLHTTHRFDVSSFDSIAICHFAMPALTTSVVQGVGAFQLPDTQLNEPAHIADLVRGMRVISLFLESLHSG